jgi:Flp pilus assembly pilin Flp
MQEMLRRLWADDSGQDIAEYAIMLAVIALVTVTAVGLIGTNANNIFNAVKDKLGLLPGGG